MTRSLATLTDLVAAVRQAIDVRSGWTDTSELVADQLRAHLPGPEILTPDQRLGRPDRVAGHLLHAEPDGAFSILGLLRRIRNVGDEIGISLHIYGTDISRVGSSARRYYN
jgi:3-mercaptopropionate dioxygenase